MTERESKLLIVGDNVRAGYRPPDIGTVMHTCHHGVQVEWGDGRRERIGHRQMAAIEADVDAAEMQNRSVRRIKRAINYLQAVRKHLAR